jgi:hypothetical protein
MKKIIFVLILIVIVGWIALLSAKKETHQTVSSSPSSNNFPKAEIRPTVAPLPPEETRGEGKNLFPSNNPAVIESTNERILIRTNLHSLIPAPEPPALPPTTVLDNARVLLHNYATQFGENPVGDNAEITAALTGKNPKQVNFLREDSGLRVNEKGEMIDTYGTPLFFHQLSAQVMEIRSAGQDRKLWTLDDQVTR